MTAEQSNKKTKTKKQILHIWKANAIVQSHNDWLD